MKIGAKKQPLVMRQKTLTVASSKGGVNKTSLTAMLAYEVARLGCRVLIVDADTNGGLSHTTGSYAPEGRSIVEVIKGECPVADAVFPIENWQPDPEVPWNMGGPAVPGGSIFILPSLPLEKAARTDSLEVLLSEAGATKEIRLATHLNEQIIQDNFDIIFIDMPGSANPSMLSNILHAAEFITLPVYPSVYAVSSLEGVVPLITEWALSANSAAVTFLGGIPTSQPWRMGQDSSARRSMEEAADWMQAEFEGEVPMYAPGIPERRTAVEAAAEQHVPVVTLARTKVDRRNLGLLPPAVTRTALSILAQMRPDNDDPETAFRTDHDVESMLEAVLSQDMPDEWRSIIAGDVFLAADHFHVGQTDGVEEEK